MEKLNLFGGIRLPPISVSAPRLYSSNVGDCGNTIYTNNSLNKFFDTSVINTNNNKNYIYYVSAASGGWSSRVLNFTQSSSQIFRDLGTVQQFAYHTLRITTYTGNQTILYFQVPNMVFATRTAVLNLTNWNNNSIMNVLALSASTSYLSPITTTGLSANNSSTYTLFTNNTTDGTLTVTTNSANGRKYILYLDIMISANFNAGSSIIVSIMLDATTLYSETFYLDNTVYNYAISMTYNYSLSSGDVGKKLIPTIQYVGGTSMTLTAGGYYSVSFINREL